MTKSNSYVSSYHPICVPADWNACQDIKAFVQEFGQCSDAGQFLQETIEIAYSDLLLCLDEALEYHLRKCRNPLPVPVAAFSLREKLNWLENFLPLTSTHPDYLSRFGEVIAYCHWVDAQRERILRGYWEWHRPPWLKLLGELTNYFALLKPSWQAGPRR